MAEFQIRADAVDVEQIMRQIRARIREKRGADYTEQEIKELASVKLEKFLDPRGIRSNLVEEFRRNRVPSPAPPALDVRIEALTVTGTHRSTLASIRSLLAPVMKLFINPNAIMHDINAAVQKLAATLNDKQTEINTGFHNRFRQREEMDSLYYEVIHNVVVELTRLSIENSNLKMRVESLSSRMDFDERRARALETVVQYKPAPRQPDRPQPERGQNDKPQGEKPQGERQHGDKPQNERAAQNERPQGERSNNERPQGERSQNERPQGDRSQGERAPQGERTPQQASAGADPQRAGLESRDQGERGERRRRRRRRRRPGQNAAGGGVPGTEANVPGQPGAQGSEPEGDYDGPDDDGPDDVPSTEGSTE